MNATSSKSIIPELDGWEDRLALVIQNAAAKSTIGRRLESGGIAKRVLRHRTPEQIEADFWMTVKIKGQDKCWLWTGSVRRKEEGRDYGSFSVDGAMISSHKFSAKLRFGELDNHHVVCHECDTPRCVNPHHLFIGSQKDNHRDMMLKGRHRAQVGSEHHASVFTEEQVHLLRLEALSKKWGWIAETSRRLGVSEKAIRDAVSGRRWKHVPFPST